MLLRLLTFAYATGVFESDEIVRLCYAEERFRSLCTAPVPSPAELGRFRRDNRGLLKCLLSQIMTRALKEKFALGDGLPPSGLRRFLTETANAVDINKGLDGAELGDAPDGGGVLVKAVQEGSPAAQNGLRANDLIVAVGRTPVSNTKAFKEAVKNANVLVLNVRRGSATQLIQIR